MSAELCVAVGVRGKLFFGEAFLKLLVPPIFRPSTQTSKLPAGSEQKRPAYCHVYLDDGAGAALNDRVPLGELATTALGGVPAPPDSRAAVHLRIAVANRSIRLASTSRSRRPSAASPSSTSASGWTRCGGASIARCRSGASCGVTPASSGRRRQWAWQWSSAAERLTGRLANLSHVLPELPPRRHRAGGGGGLHVAARGRHANGRDGRERR